VVDVEVILRLPNVVGIDRFLLHGASPFLVFAYRRCRPPSRLRKRKQGWGSSSTSIAAAYNR
jgi:hypothetical protein